MTRPAHTITTTVIGHTSRGVARPILQVTCTCGEVLGQTAWRHVAEGMHAHHRGMMDTVTPDQNSGATDG